MSMIKITRNNFKHQVNNALNLFKIDPENIRGSFNGNNFHFIESKRITFSDIDLMIDSHAFPSDIHKQIEGEILKKTSVHVPVSIHKKNCLSEMTLSESQDLAVLECIYQSTKKQFHDARYQTYIRCKFAILISRISVKETYSDVVNRLNCDESDLWLQVKCGAISKEKMCKINYWPTVNRLNTFWDHFFHSKNENISQVSIYYYSVMNETSLPLLLKTRINEKLRSNGINFNVQ